MARKKERLDVLMVERGLAESRSKAQALIMAGLVSLDPTSISGPRVGGGPPVKAGAMLSPDVSISVKPAKRWVGRGGEKLEGAILDFHLKGRVDGDWLDAGASTGGFVDVLLHYGAKRVFAVDVGLNQLDEKLRIDSRVIVLDRRNVRSLSGADIPELLDGLTLDLSFISIRIVLPALRTLLKPSAFVVALVKPQFEGERRDVGKGGIVRDEPTRVRILDDFERWCLEGGWKVMDRADSRVAGRKGNREQFFHIRPPAAFPTDLSSVPERN